MEWQGDMVNWKDLALLEGEPVVPLQLCSCCCCQERMEAQEWFAVLNFKRSWESEF